MKRSFLISFLFLAVIFQSYSQVPKVTSISSGTNFSCASYDAEGNLWVGTTNAGLYKDMLNDQGQFGNLQRFSTNANFNSYNIQSIATPTINGRTSIWVATNGRGGGVAQGGGVYEFATTSTTEPRYYIAERNDIVSRGMGLRPAKNDGLPSRHCRDVAIDKYGTVWTAHSYHDFTMLDGASSKYIITPGGIGMKPANKGIFDNKSMPLLPYPAFTVNPKPNETPQTRRCLSIAARHDQVWMGFAAYEKDGGGSQYAGIAMYDLAGNQIGILNSETAPELPFTTSFASPMAFSIHFQKNGDPWIAFNRDLGFAVLKNSGFDNKEWIYVSELQHYNKQTGEQEVSTLLPTSAISFNLMPDLITSAGRRVFLGTTAGLLVYDGKGDIRQDSSYTLVTTADGLSSNNIRAVTTAGGFVIVVTDQGVDQVFVPADISIFHISRKETPFDHTIRSNYEEITSLSSEPILNNPSYNDNNLPIFSADGTTSSLFRYYTDDFDGFYNDKYLFGIENDFDGEDTAKYGKFTLRPANQYPNNRKEYVDFVYRHPIYLDPSFVNEKKDAVYSFSIYEKFKISSVPVFHHKVKISLPPVLLVHGVWTSIESLEYLEKGLREEANYPPYKTLRKYKPMPKDAEVLYPGDAHHIPDGIKQLIRQCKENNMSAGKVSLVVHSRGGLYSRAYIEEIQTKIPFEHNVHSLITLNTPHSGSQLANLVLDRRPVVIMQPQAVNPWSPGTTPRMEPITVPLGDIFAIVAVPEKDMEPKNGAEVLRVDKGFIHELNDDANLEKFKKARVPVHAVATTFSFCHNECEPPSIWGAELPESVPVLNKAYQIFRRMKTPAKQSLDDFIESIFNGEKSDFIVPKSSMEGGLLPQYISRFEGLNIPHSDLPLVSKGVTNFPEVRPRVIELLAQNVQDPQSNFTMNGYNPPRGANALKYTFLQDDVPAPAPAARMNAENEQLLFYFERMADTVSLHVGDTIKIKLISSQIEETMISYESINSPDAIFLDTKEIKGDTSIFKFVIPGNYNGKFMVIGYGFRNNMLVAMDQMELYAGISDTIILEDIYFDSYSTTIEMMEIEKHPFSLAGLYSDGATRNITEMTGVTFSLTDNTVAKIVDGFELQGLKEGYTYLVASYEGKSDSLQVLVFANPDKNKTVFGTFYVAVDESKKMFFDWTMLQEYKCSEFIIEESTDSIEFTPLHTVAAFGNTYEMKKYSYQDMFDSEGVVHYRIKVIDSLGAELYSSVRTVVPAGIVSSVGEKEIKHTGIGISLYPNPGSGRNVNLRISEHISEHDAEAVILNSNGIHIASRHLSIDGNQVPLMLPEYIVPGIYIVQLKTSKGVFSTKLVINN